MRMADQVGAGHAASHVDKACAPQQRCRDVPMRPLLALTGLCLAIVAGSLAAGGCAHVPGAYTMPPYAVEEIHAQLSRVGVVVASDRAELSFARPAKGWTGGALRGLASGAFKTLAVGVIVPVPGSALVGVILAPVGGLVGMTYGIANAVPAEEVEQAEKAIDHALDRLQALQPQHTIRDAVVQRGRERTPFEFVALADLGPQTPTDVVRYEAQDLPNIDTILELQVAKGGLKGPWEIDPSSSAFIEMRARLIRVSDHTVLYDDTISCRSEERKYTAWAVQQGQPLYEAFIACLPRLTEKVIDDFFLVYPLATK